MQQETLREKAWQEFQRVARAEVANGCETLALFKLTPQFSTAPLEDTEEIMTLFRYWSRKGDGEALLMFGQELYDWAQDNGYQKAPKL